MINLQTLKVKVQNVDIAPMVLSLTMFETIKGNARGSLTVQDNVLTITPLVVALLELLGNSTGISRVDLILILEFSRMVDNVYGFLLYSTKSSK